MNGSGGYEQNYGSNTGYPPHSDNQPGYSYPGIFNSGYLTNSSQPNGMPPNGLQYGVQLNGGYTGGAGMARSQMIEANTNDAQLNGAHMYGGHMNGVGMNGAGANGASINGVGMNGEGMNGAGMGGSGMNGGPLNGAQMMGAQANGAPLNGASMNGAPYSGSQGSFTPQNLTPLSASFPVAAHDAGSSSYTMNQGSQRQVDVSAAAGEMMQILERPYQQRGDVIGPNHGLSCIGSLENLITPEHWQPGLPPQHPSQAREFFNFMRNHARDVNNNHFYDDPLHPPHEQAQRHELRRRNWDQQFRLDQIVLNERLFIHFHWNRLRQRGLQDGWLVVAENGALVENYETIVANPERFLAFYHEMVPAWSRFEPPQPTAGVQPSLAPSAPQVPTDTNLSIDPTLMNPSLQLYGAAPNGMGTMPGAYGTTNELMSQPNSIGSSANPLGQPASRGLTGGDQGYLALAPQATGHNERSFTRHPIHHGSAQLGYPDMGGGYLGVGGGYPSAGGGYPGVGSSYPGPSMMGVQTTPSSYYGAAMQSNVVNPGTAPGGTDGYNVPNLTTEQTMNQNFAAGGFPMNGNIGNGDNSQPGHSQRVNPFNAGFGSMAAMPAGGLSAENENMQASKQTPRNGKKSIGKKRARPGSLKVTKRGKTPTYVAKALENMGPPPTLNVSATAMQAGDEWAKERGQDDDDEAPPPPRRKRGKDVPTAAEGLRISSSLAQSLVANGAPTRQMAPAANVPSAPTQPIMNAPNSFAPQFQTQLQPTAPAPRPRPQLTQYPGVAAPPPPGGIGAYSSGGIINQGPPPPPPPPGNAFQNSINQIVRSQNDAVARPTSGLAADISSDSDEDDDEDDEDGDEDGDEDDGDGSSSSGNNDDPSDGTYGRRAGGPPHKRVRAEAS